MRLTRVVLTYRISSITSKISWIVSWPWSNHVCVCVCECASVSVCDWFYKLIHGPQEQILVFLVWKFWFWPGEVMEKAWDFFSEIFVGTLYLVFWAGLHQGLTLHTAQLRLKQIVTILQIFSNWHFNENCCILIQILLKFDTNYQ